jgi:hypothetical protein
VNTDLASKPHDQRIGGRRLELVSETSHLATGVVWLFTPYLPILVLILRAPWSPKTKLGIIAGLVIVGLGVAAISSVVSEPERGTSSPTRPSTSPTATADTSPGEAVVTAACDQAFSIAASVDVMHDTVEDLDPALEACKSVKEWVMAAGRYPKAIDADPRIFLNNRCDLGAAWSRKASCARCSPGNATPNSQQRLEQLPKPTPFFEG